MFALPPTRSYRLASPPLAQALVQVRFPLEARLSTVDGIAAIQERLRGDYPVLRQQEMQTVEVRFSPVGVEDEPTRESFSTSYVFSDADGADGFAVLLSSTEVTLTVGTAYRGVDDFARRLGQVLAAVDETGEGPARCDRLGVRFLNLVPIRLGAQPHEWTTWFTPALLGWPATDVVPPDTHLHAAINQVTLVASPHDSLAGMPGDVQAVVRHGVAPQGSLVPGVPQVALDEDTFLLDTDLFVLTPQEWDTSEVVEQFRTMHGQIDRLFRWSLTPDGEAHFGLEEDDA